MNREQKLESLQLYLQSFERLPDDAYRQGISLYEFRTVIQLIYEILEDKSALFEGAPTE